MKKDGQTLSARVLAALAKCREGTVSEIRFVLYRGRPPKNARSLIWNVLRRHQATGLCRPIIRQRCGRNPGTIWTLIA